MTCYFISSGSIYWLERLQVFNYKEGERAADEKLSAYQPLIFAILYV